MRRPFGEDTDVSRLYTVKQMARLSGVSVRALHHYDQIGLLKPASVGENGYRYYGREELLRLQQILLHRELDLPLGEIAAVLDAPGFDRLAALRTHRDRLAAKAERYRTLLKTLDDTLAALEGEQTMDDKDLYAGFAPGKQAEYEAWLIDRHGEPMRERIDAAKTKMKGLGKAGFEALMAEAGAIEQAMAKALADGLPADCETVRALMRRHRDWIAASWNRPPTAEAFAGLAGLYLEHPDFRARYEAVRPGLTEYLAEAMRRFAEAEM
ncbi:DNA-binding transcriptional MerR regulator [Caulobacter ginsengisoli]|uniref:DNA-binding transcriptional MerR regulator n=1 Tax=Caulobacter ginsengisoli TaxID=400775 RepID=A0ABU0IRZ1_9CAUL|nr:MerR family transcriptional regulator [Caulobacter ginsengisoli]MDQ0464778.1 DNA-binding transcriptional MerR regulator [Caulobacter ginsengisoli]